MRQEMNSAQRTWSLTRGEKLPGVERISWSRTIADVRIDTAEQYIDDVRRWAAAVLRDAEELVGG